VVPVQTLYLVLLLHLVAVGVDHIQQGRVWLVALVVVLAQIHLVVEQVHRVKGLRVEIVPQLHIKMALAAAALVLLERLT
jgi:hypothetical protein